MPTRHCRNARIFLLLVGSLPLIAFAQVGNQVAAPMSPQDSDKLSQPIRITYAPPAAFDPMAVNWEPTTFAGLTSLESDHCSDVLGNVLDITSHQSNDYVSMNVEHFFCDKTFSSYSEAKEAARSVGIDIGPFSLGGGGGSEESRWQSYQREVCAAIRDRSQRSQTINDYIQHIDGQVIRAWSECIAQRRGLIFWAEVDQINLPGLFTIHAVWRGVGFGNHLLRLNPNPARRLRVLPAENAKCDPIESPVDDSGQVTTCVWTHSERSTTVTIRPIGVGTQVVNIPPVRKTVARTCQSVSECVPARGWWPFPVARGDEIEIQASTTAACSGWRTAVTVSFHGPEGDPQHPTNPGVILPSQVGGRLIGGFSTSAVTTTGQLFNTFHQNAFDVGSGPVRKTAPDDGWLYLFTNDTRAFPDNEGGVRATISICKTAGWTDEAVRAQGAAHATSRQRRSRRQ
jgi:hypothetical protein